MNPDDRKCNCYCCKSGSLFLDFFDEFGEHSEGDYNCALTCDCIRCMTVSSFTDLDFDEFVMESRK